MRSLSIFAFLFVITLINTIADAGALLELDLSVNNKVTITATTESAIVSKAGNTGCGFILDLPVAGGNVAVNDLPTTFGFKSSGALVRPEIVSVVGGINLFEQDFCSGVSSSVTAGEQAFVGTSTFTLVDSQYSAFLNIPNSAKIYAFGGNDAFLIDPFQIGDWSIVSSSAFGTKHRDRSELAMPRWQASTAA